MKTGWSIKLCAAAAFCCISVFAAGAMAKGDKDDRHGKHERYEEKKHGRGDERGHKESYFRKHGHSRLHIPHEHYPPPGECRIWYPDRHRGHKPERINCGMIPPQGAWLLHHPSKHQGYLNIKIYEGAMISIGEFELRSGAFIRDLDLDNDY